MDDRWRILCSGDTELRGRGKEGLAMYGTWRKHEAWPGGKPPGGSAACDAERKRVAKSPGSPPRKAAMAVTGPVPQTDTGRQVEETKADGRSIVKELGKTAP